MNPSIRLGRISGIEIGLNWSWLVVFTLITWTLAVGVFPDQNPGLSDERYVAMAVVASIVFFATLLAHELAHALVARREGMQIDGITLWLFGGVARFRGGFPSAGAEFRIAIAGPLVSVAIGAVLLALALLVDLPATVDGPLFWLGWINLILAVFNLLPALPLDGGRVLRSALWRARDDFAWATRIAAAVSRAFGFGLIALGVFMFIFQGTFSGVWLAFIGWFLLQAAGAEVRQLLVRDALGGLRVRDLMTSDPATVPAEMTLGRFMDEVAWSTRFTTYPVLDGDGRAVGLLAFSCVAQVPRAEWDTRTVRDCMIPAERVPLLSGDEPAEQALGELGENSAGRGLVLERGRLVGLLSITDMLRALEARPARPRLA